MAGSSARPCHYAMLGVARDASAADIRSAYRQLVLVSTLYALHAFCFIWPMNATHGGARLTPASGLCVLYCT